MKKRILALDTSTEVRSVALFDGTKIITKFEKCSYKHANRILSMIRQVLDESGLKLNQLDVLAFGKGPGNFTGIRICTNIIQGLAFGTGIPVVGVSTLKTIAQGAWRMHKAHKVLVTINFTSKEVYLAKYQRDNSESWHGENNESKVSIVKIQNSIHQLVNDWTLVGTGWKNIFEYSKEKSSVKLDSYKKLYPTAEDIIPLAFVDFIKNKFINVDKINPVYLN